MGIVDPVMFVMVATVHQLVSKTNGVVLIFINFTVVVLLETCAL